MSTDDTLTQLALVINSRFAVVLRTNEQFAGGGRERREREGLERVHAPQQRLREACVQSARPTPSGTLARSPCRAASYRAIIGARGLSRASNFHIHLVIQIFGVHAVLSTRYNCRNVPRLNACIEGPRRPLAAPS